MDLLYIKTNRKGKQNESKTSNKRITTLCK